MTAQMTVVADDDTQRLQWMEYIEETCEDYGICPELIESIIYYESNWNPNEVSSTGAEGLMQIKPQFNTERMERLGLTDLTDPYQSILCGIDLIASYQSRGMEVYEALVIYRYGEYSTQYEMWKLYGGSITYADRVLAYSAELEVEHGK